MSPDEVNFVRGLISEDKAPQLLNVFIEQGHTHWEKAWLKNSDFATNEMPKIFAQHFDAEVLAVPIKCYNKLRKGVEGFEDQTTWPVIEEDISATWTLVGNLIKIAVRYTIANQDKYPDVPAVKYAERFCITV